MILNGTVFPWVSGVLGILIIITIGIALSAWRDSKSSPYFFLRRQAEQKMQSYLTASSLLIVAALVVGFYGWQAPVDQTIRAAVLQNAKPLELVEAEAVEIVASPELIPLGVSQVVDLVTIPDVEKVVNTVPRAIAAGPLLPDQYYSQIATKPLDSLTSLDSVAFAKAMDEAYQPVSPRRVFGEGAFTLYATFLYEAMADGMEWSWVWRHNGRILGGGNEMWQYGDEGNGYIYLTPEEGFDPGEYTLEVWVNGKLMRQANVIVSSQAAR